MTKDEAIEAIEAGKRVTHVLWDENAFDRDEGFERKPFIEKRNGVVQIDYGYDWNEEFSYDSMTSPVGWELV